jgi:uncharacterized membrane protein HdeD (DUF308 family)
VPEPPASERHRGRTVPLGPITLGALDEDIRRALGDRWRWILVSGVLATLAGLVAIAVPALASVTTELFIGWLILFVAVVLVVDGFSPPRSVARVVLRLLYAGLFAFAGIYLLLAPLEGTVTLTFVLAAWLIAVGLVRLWAAWRERGLAERGLVAVNGLASIGLGVLIAVEFPSSADWAIGLLVGIDFLLYGLSAIWAARAGRELARAGA